MRSGRRNVMNHIASRERIFGRRGAENLFYHELYCDESVIMTIYEFQNFVTSVPGVETCPYMTYGRGLPIYGSLHPSTCFLVD